MPAPGGQMPAPGGQRERCRPISHRVHGRFMPAPASGMAPEVSIILTVEPVLVR
jgi:hypothetical protein